MAVSDPVPNRAARRHPAKVPATLSRDTLDLCLQLLTSATVSGSRSEVKDVEARFASAEKEIRAALA